jgi:putative hydrolase of the HAD superfamily
MIAAVLFDLDETLLDRTNSLRLFLADQYERFALSLGGPELQAWSNRFLELDARGRVAKSLVYPSILSEFGGDMSLAPVLLQDYQERCRHYARPLPDALKTVQELGARGFRIGVVTNGQTEFQSRHVDALGLRDLVDAVLISEAEGLRKPDPRLFHRAADRLGVEPAGCLFVGDNPEHDILGASAAGMRTAWLHHGTVWPVALSPLPGEAIANLSQVIDLACGS